MDFGRLGLTVVITVFSLLLVFVFAMSVVAFTSDGAYAGVLNDSAGFQDENESSQSTTTDINQADESIQQTVVDQNSVTDDNADENVFAPLWDYNAMVDENGLYSIQSVQSEGVSSQWSLNAIDAEMTEVINEARELVADRQNHMDQLTGDDNRLDEKLLAEGIIMMQLDIALFEGMQNEFRSIASAVDSQAEEKTAQERGLVLWRAMHVRLHEDHRLMKDLLLTGNQVRIVD